MLVSLARSREVSLERLINGLGIRHVGEHTARQLAQRFGSLEALMTASEEELRLVRIGERPRRAARAFGVAHAFRPS